MPPIKIIPATMPDPEIAPFPAPPETATSVSRKASNQASRDSAGRLMNKTGRTHLSIKFVGHGKITTYRGSVRNSGINSTTVNPAITSAVGTDTPRPIATPMPSTAAI